MSRVMPLIDGHLDAVDNPPDPAEAQQAVDDAFDVAICASAEAGRDVDQDALAEADCEG